MRIRSYGRDCVGLVLGALSACQHQGVAPQATNARTAPLAPKSSLAGAAATAAKATLAAAAAAEAPDPSPFVEALRLGYNSRLAVTGKSAFLSTEKLLLAIHDDNVAVEPALLEGLHPGASQFPRVFGSMPEAAWAVEMSYAERTSHASLSRWTGSEWKNADSLLNGRNVIGISPWSAGRTLALIGDEYPSRLDFVQLGGPRGAPLPQLERTARNDFGCARGMQPSAMSALATGEVFLAGTRCSVGSDDSVTTHGAVVQRWGAGQTRGKLSVLPMLAEQEAASADLTSIVASSANDVFVAGSRTPAEPEGADGAAYLAHFDGTAWRALPAPPSERIDELQRTPDGKLWALSNGDLWTTTSNATENTTWQQVPLPRLAKEAGEHAVSSFWVQDTGAVWATVGADGFSYLLRTKRGPAPLAVPSDEQVAELSKAVDPNAAYDCEHPTLVLLTLGRAAPKDADMPSVRAALRGHTELAGKATFVEIPFLTRRYLAALGDADTLQQTREIVAQANIPGVEPEMRCLNAAPTRTLNVDFAGPKPEPKSAPKRGSKTARAAASELDRTHLAPVDLF